MASTATDQSSLARLEDVDAVLAHASDDLTGQTVVDPNGHRVGEVDGLIIDLDERRARLLIVASGGQLGLARVRRLLPVDAVTRIDDRVHIEVAHEDVHSGAEYRPGVGPSPRYADVYAHYGYSPYWDASYVSPYFLRRT
ncbi:MULTISPECIES: PRC-barrel domain-containing protein [unclassified Nocardioides]|uniref:PRC-barrel domain-containing protein n=1 Tax=unclassified Nocardioides TaxID=2615069 RepID=UPI0009F06FDB|nr:MULTISPECIES: PRC-barrel domain-containing protein [unclassified Nocardioides]GAW52248.1 PRC-barrel domain protein [Nocardioides sp. PD653-B2]GAW56067.1 PRC-barrel domain protein [Nocardioides sp. PD653]